MRDRLEEIGESAACVRCGYDLIGLTPDGVCPECGAGIGLTVPACPRCARTNGAVVALGRRKADLPGCWECACCGGIAFERDKLRAAASEMERPAPGSVQAIYDLVALSSVTCTRCAGPMQSIVLDTHTLIDRCGACGLIWVDMGELAAVQAFMRRHLGNAHPPRKLEEMLDDPEAIRAAARERADTAESVQDTIGWIALTLSLLGW